ncbi:MAG: DUF2117 domain-containing protein [Euryarchaeota archaeon]|nr:DUF2117 domain-containing protein [Euryarchaeota archaeon]
MKIGVVVHGPEIVDSGYAELILNLLEEYGHVKARLGGTMGRTAVLDAELENTIDITKKRLPSESIDKFADEGSDVIFLINYGKSEVTGHSFGFKVFRRCRKNPNLIQIERPGDADGSIIPWTVSLRTLADNLSKRLNLKVINPEKIRAKMFSKNYMDDSFNGDAYNRNNQNKSTRTYRKIAGVSPDENIFLNGIVIGRSISDEVTIVVKDGSITEIIGGNLKRHGVEKLGKIDIENSIIKTGLLRRAMVTPRVLESTKRSVNFNVAFLNHAAEDIYKFRDVDMVVTVGDDTTLVAADILYRFKVPIIGITDGDIDKVVENGFKSTGSMIVELEEGWDDLIGEKIFSKLFNGKETIEIENIENFKKEILQIVNNTGVQYTIKY